MHWMMMMNSSKKQSRLVVANRRSTNVRLRESIMAATNRSVKMICVFGRLHVSRSNIAIAIGRPRAFSSSD